MVVLGQNTAAAVAQVRPEVRPPGRLSVVDGEAPRGAVNAKNLLRLLKHQGHRCAPSGRELTPKTAALDHIVPITRGGRHRIENIQALHKQVNRAKGTMTNAEFIGLCRDVAARGRRGTA